MEHRRSRKQRDILSQFGNRLRTLRLAKGLTQEELAEMADFSRSYYTEIENGKRNVSLLNLQRLADCLAVSIAQLVNGGEG